MIYGSRFRLISFTRFFFIQDFLAFASNLLPAPLSRQIRVPHFPAIKNISSYFCLEPRTSLSVLKSLSPLAFLQRDGTDIRRRVNNTRRHAKECTSVFILWLRVRNANSILRGTTPVLGRSDTLRICSSGTQKLPLTSSAFENR